jgi:hypothetical protein
MHSVVQGLMSLLGIHPEDRVPDNGEEARWRRVNLEARLARLAREVEVTTQTDEPED